MDRFQEALHDVSHVLNEIKEGFGRKPTASRAALERFEAAMRGQKGGLVNLESGPRGDGGDINPQSEIPNPQSDSSGLEKRSWDELRAAALGCRKCPHLVSFRTQVVFGVGNPHAELMFVGEAPGADEDVQGEPFVGKAGQLLTKIIETMGLKRSDVYIANVVKCRPDMPPGVSGNRKPSKEEMETCIPWLAEQIGLVSPKAIVALGATAAEGLLGEVAPMRELRGKWFSYRDIPVVVTYHPAYLLRNQSISEKRKVWVDMMMVMERLGMPISEKQKQFFLPEKA